MARFSERDRRAVDRLVDRWRHDCLVADGSLLVSGQQAWTPENVQELVRRFNERQLEDQRSFEEKLTEQLEGAPQEAVQLMAEVITVYFLFASSVGAGRKRELVEVVLALGGETPPIPEGVTRAFQAGIGGPGQYFNSGRPFLLSYLIDFARRFKTLDVPERERLLSDPWTFRSWLVGEEEEADGGPQMMRQILLHLLFPDEYERIASGSHKDRIAEAFGPLMPDGAEHRNVDERLLEIRRRIEELMPEGQPQLDGKIDFYYAPLREAWDLTEGDESDSGGGISNLGALEYKRQVVLYGPPGTGKTYEAKDLALRLLRHHALQRWKAPDYLRRAELIEELAERQIRRLQLHQSYSYEDFVWGMRIGMSGATVPQPGYLLELVDEIEKSQRIEPAPGLAPLPWVLILDEVNRVDLSRLLGEAFSALEDRDAAVDLPMLDEDGHRRQLRLPRDLYLIATMNLIDQSVEQLDFALRRRFLWVESGFRAEVIPQVVQSRGEQQPISGRHSWERLRPDIDLLAERATLLNGHVRASNLLGAQYELGHTYFFDVVGFMTAWLTPSSRPHGYLWRTSGRQPQPPLLDLWRHSLSPLLREYLAGIEPQAASAELARLQAVFLDGKE